ncbi:DNA translocase FtsK 4TM domain-containing protein [candidate division TA06 bacterium]|uniref:DNA translocase FtsK 4TM domain-containing protein n=1 Tax=candidate division TA06 bacterium TaxID=2250710 RepID=A0A933MI03_UNCT6|nr:DNA translocase FtsK 4TM domain-containing protein [candidate division TA06 bacterium]
MKSEEKEKKSAPEFSRGQEIFGVTVIIAGLFLLVSLVSFSGHDSHLWSQEWPRRNWGGPLGDLAAFGLIGLLGYAALLLPFYVLVWGWFFVRHKKLYRLLWNSLLSLTFISFALAMIARLNISYYTGDLPAGVGLAEPSGAGKWGMLLASFIVELFGPVGFWLVLAGIFIILLLIGTKINFQRWLTLATAPVKTGLQRAKPKPREITFKKKPAATDKPGKQTQPPLDQSEPAPSSEKTKPELEPSKSEKKSKAKPPVREDTVSEEYQQKFLSILYDDRGQAKTDEEDKSSILLEKLKEFGIEGAITDRYSGPVITRYEFKPAPGVKVNQIANLSDDLALAMQATRIRIIAPIPGKGVVGIEIPNQHRQMVMLKEMLASDNYKSQEGCLAFALGKTITGDSFSADLTNMPHLLIAGATGSGKSVCLNAVITSLLYRATPEELHFIMIDPKRIELSIYRGIPHLQFQYRVQVREGEEPITRTVEGVVTDSDETLQIFRMAVSEMDARYKMLAKEACRNIEEYNHKFERQMSYLVIVIDELADLMLSREASEIENRIAKLAQLSRAVGIHLILATQRPSVDVITGVIKANFPSRLAFQVASRTDSRTILDANGAESLLGRGDMLYMPPGKAEPERLHGAFISTKETNQIVDFVKSWYGVAEGQADNKESSAVPEQENGYSMEVDLPPEEGASQDGQDELFAEARSLVIRHQQGSVSLLQRRLKIGYSRAARLIDQLEAAEVVGSFDGSKARQVLIKNEEDSE